MITDEFSLGDIIPGEGVGIFRLGMTWEALQRYLPEHYDHEQRHGCFVVKLPSLWFFIDDSKKAVTQIIALNNFHGKLHGKIGIGSTGMDVANVLGRCSLNDNLGYEADGHPGVSFYAGPASNQYQEKHFELRPIAYIAVHTKGRFDMNLE